MGNYAYFVGCGGRERTDETDGPELEAKNDVPLFWLAAFDVEDLWVLRQAGERPEVALCAPAAAGLDRLRRRREAVLGLVGERFDALYDAWIEHVARAYPRSLLLRTWIEDEEDEEEQGVDQEVVLREPLTALVAADRGEAIPRAAFDRVEILHGIDPDEPAADGALRRRAILAGWSVPRAGETWHWPPPPTGEEVGRVDGRRGSNVVPAIPDDLAPEALGDLLARRFVEAVAEVWACAIPQAALHAVWARGEYVRVYEVARLREFRAPMLAWYAGLDPEPRAPRVTQAASQALAAAASAEQLLSVVALIPFVAPEVVRRARRVAKEGSRIVLALRLDAALAEDGAAPPLDDPHAGGEVAAVLYAFRALKGMLSARPCALEDAFASLLGDLEQFNFSQAPALQASAALWLADSGLRAEAEFALRRALDVPILHGMIQPAMLPAIRRVGAWDQVEVDRHLVAPHLLDAAFMAGRDGEDAVRRLLPMIADEGLRAAAAGCAALGAGSALAVVQAALAGEWQEEARGGEPVDSELAWAIRFGRAVDGNPPREGVDGLVRAAFAEAVEAARTFVARIEGELGDGAGAPDLARARALLRELAQGEGDLDCLLRADAHPLVLVSFAPVLAAIDPAAAAGARAGLRAALAGLPAP